MNKDQVSDFYAKNFDQNLKELNHECDLLREWFRRDFPESDLKLIVDVDNILRTFKITVRVLTHMDNIQNQGFFENKIILTEKDIINPSFMRAFFKHFGTRYREEIARSVNNHYNQVKAQENADI